MGKLPPALSRIENGGGLPSVEFIERYARAIGRPIDLRFGAAQRPDAEVRRGRALRALFWAYDSPMKNKERYFSREVRTAVSSEGVDDATATYLRLLEAAVDDLGLYVSIAHHFKTAVAYASACLEAIDWARVRSELAQLRGDTRGDGMRAVHLRVVRRIWDVVQATTEGRRRRA
jgi:transcriptional regulator with XRE-family HTH domain